MAQNGIPEESEFSSLDKSSSGTPRPWTAACPMDWTTMGGLLFKFIYESLKKNGVHRMTVRPYILKAKKFAELPFQSKNIAGKVRVIFGPFWVILGSFWAFLGHFGSYLCHFGPF